MLFVAIVILAIGITRFYFNVSKNTGSSNDSAEIIRRLDKDNNGNRIFENSTGLYGIADKRDKIIVAPEWVELDFADGKSCIASKRIGASLLTGCINYEGDVTVPFIYRNIVKYKKNNFTFYIAESDSDRSCTLYNQNFIPLFLHSWDSAKVTDDTLILTKNMGTATYSFSENGLICQNASLSAETINKNNFLIELKNQTILSELSFIDLEKIAAATGTYLEYAFTGNGSELEKYVNTNLVAFSEIFPEENNITSKKLNNVEKVLVFSEKSESGIKIYNVSLSVNATITYKNNEGKTKSLNGDYKAVIKFKDSSSGITAASGSFTQTVPNYPPEPQEDNNIENHNQNQN